MNDLRTAAQQALEALIKGCNINATEWHQAIYALRSALAQQAEPAKTFLITGNEFCGAPPAPYATWGDALADMLDAGKIEGLRISALRAALAEPAQEPITRLFGTLPVHDTQQALPQHAEPVQKPVNAAIKAVEEGK